MDNTKSIFLSKTFWVNFIAFVAGLSDPVLDYVATMPDNAQVMGFFVSMFAMINVINRFFTEKKVRL